jgi:VCBS repeat-containing protein
VLVSIPAHSQYFQATVPVKIGNEQFDVLVELGLDAGTGQIYAHFQSVDPATSLPPDVLTGFLPPENGTGRGQGHLSYTVRSKPNLPTGTVIKNIAVIQFDHGEIIATNQIAPHDPSQGTDPTREARNTIDAGTPSSQVASLPATAASATFNVAWSGQDDSGGSGVGAYDIYVGVDGGAYALWQSATSATSVTYTGQLGRTYRFYSIARDNVGHFELAPAQPDAITSVPDNFPPLISNQSFSVPENSSVDTVVGTVVASDSGASPTLTYSLISGNVGSAFTIDAGTGVIHPSTGTSLNFEATSTYTLTVQVSDNGSPSLSSSAQITIHVTDVNEAPTIAGGQTFSLVENSPVNTLVGTVVASDADTNDIRTYEIVSGNSSGTFAINGTSGAITVANAGALDFETTSSFTLTIKVSDNGSPSLSSTAQLAIQVTDANEPPAILLNQSFTVLSNAVVGTAVGTVAATDPDTSGPNSIRNFSIEPNHGTSAFTINAQSGQISVADAAFLSAMGGQVILLEITDTDGGNPALSVTGTVSVTVIQANTAPTLGTPGPASTFYGNLKTPVKVFPTLTLTDADGTATLASVVISLPLGAAKKNPDIIATPGLSGIGTRADAVVNGRLQITLTLRPGATNSSVESMLRSLTFQTKGSGLKVLSRNFQIQVTDTTGLHSNVISQTVVLSKKSPKPPKH